MSTVEQILAEVQMERLNQDAKWGEQNHPNGSSSRAWFDAAEEARETTDEAAGTGKLTWVDILTEEVFEAYAEDEPKALREELIQSAAVIVAWIECIDRQS